MIQLTVGEQEFNLKEGQLKILFEEISCAERRTSKSLQEISDKIAELDNINFMVFRREVGLKMLHLPLASADLFNVVFDIVITNDEIKKLDVSADENLELRIDIKAIFKKIREKKNYQELLAKTIDAKKNYHSDPQYILLLYLLKEDLAKYLSTKRSIFAIFKKVNAEKAPPFVTVLEKIGYNLEKVIEIVSNESGKIFLEILQKLIDKGVKTDIALQKAVSRVDVLFIQTILNGGANTDILDERGKTLLGEAVDRGNAIAVDALLLGKANPNIQNIHGETPLVRACNRGDLALVNLLVKYGSDVNISDNEGKTPFIIATDRTDKSVAEFLLKHKANYKDMKYLLKDGMKDRRKKYIQILIEFLELTEAGYKEILNSNIGPEHNVKALSKEYAFAKQELEDMQNFKGIVTPDSENKELDIKQIKLDRDLITAVINQDTEKVEKLLKAGANPNYENQDGFSNTNLIHFAVWNENLAMSKALLEHNVVLDRRDVNGDTGLFFSVVRRNLDLFILLINNGANLYLTNNSGISSYDLVREQNLEEFSIFLQQKKLINPNAPIA